MTLHGYYRSTAAWRVRIALNLKGLAYDDVFHHLRRGEQRDPAYLQLNPQGLLPALETDGAVLTQSLAICAYLDETHPQPPLMPADPLTRAKVRAAAMVIACDTHPVQNLKVLNRLRALELSEEQVAGWARDTVDEGLDAFAALLPDTGPYCFGGQVTLADLCLVPQLYNARRFGVAMRWPRLLAVDDACARLDAFARAVPENQADAE